jgi:hypothetical protein
MRRRLIPLALMLATLAAPPSGRPPVGPLERFEPRAYDVSFQVTLGTTVHQDALSRVTLHLENTPIVFPLIYQSTFCRIGPDSITAHLWPGELEDLTLPQRRRIDGGLPYGGHLVVIPVTSFHGQSLRWKVAFTTTVWSSRVDDRAAAGVAWPREWPAEAADGLKPQMYIESDAPVFTETVERASGGRLRLVPPYLAAKDLVRYAISNVQVSGNGTLRLGMGFIHGMSMQGALATAASGRGSPHDLVCVCVALLRAAGIPARPVIGIEKNEKGVSDFVSWAEFYLPEAGWVPFDPMELRGQSLHVRDVREPWKGMGTLKDLNRRVPLAFHFIPPVAVQAPQAPAVWGWDPRPAGAPDAEQYIDLGMASRGRVPDPIDQDR